MSIFCLYANIAQGFAVTVDTVPVYQDGKVRKSIYPQSTPPKSKIYNKLWGRHYRDLYKVPITVQPVHLSSLYGGLRVVEQAPKQYGLFLENKNGNLYLMRLVGGYTTFLESGFFKKVYNQKEYKETYLDSFIKDAYTITNPYTFIVADKLAGKLSLSAFDPHIYYIPPRSVQDTIADGTGIEDRLVSIYNIGAQVDKADVLETDTILHRIKEDKSFEVDLRVYIRERLFDMLVGDWNKTNDNWKWIGTLRNDSTVYYTPVVVDRVHAFTKVDGFFFKGILGMFGLKCISDYDYTYGNLRKTNGFSFPLDAALTVGCDRSLWLEEARYIKSTLTDEVIDRFFLLLPKEVQGKDTDEIKAKLKARRNGIENVAARYYHLLQKNPVITGTEKDDRFEIVRDYGNNVRIRIYDEADKIVFDKVYDKDASEIWIYGLGGNDRFSVSGESGKKSLIVLVGGKGDNSYDIKNKDKLKIFEYKSHSTAGDVLPSKTKMVKTDIENVHAYDFNKLKYSTLDFTPWGVYDSDLGLYLGAYVTKTLYGFRRASYTYRHRMGYNYLNGFQYQGFFPTYDEKQNFIIEGFFGTPNNFVNFFGYGNETSRYKDESKKYNRVNMYRLSVSPSYNYKFDEKHKITAQASVEVFKFKESKERYVNHIYDDDDIFFDSKTFADINLSYQVNKALAPAVPKLDFDLITGWKVNVKDMERNYLYVSSSLGLNFALTQRLTLATELNGKVLFTDDKYEFYQAAATDLRGYRGNRFIGNRAMYQHTDLRLDLGRLENPFTPILYGVFAGFDYGRVWYSFEDSKKWHNSYGGGFWITLFKGYTGKFSYFGSKDGNRFSFGLGMGF